MGGKYDFMYKAAKKSVVTLIKHAVNERVISSCWLIYWLSIPCGLVVLPSFSWVDKVAVVRVDLYAVRVGMH